MQEEEGQGGPTSDTEARGATVTLAEVLEDLMSQRQRRKRLLFGLGALDSTLGGIEAGRLTLIAGPPSACGSLLAGLAAYRAAIEEERRVLYLASGVSPADLAWRWTSQDAHAHYSAVRAESSVNYPYPGEYERAQEHIREAIERLRTSGARLSITETATYAGFEAAILQSEPELVVVDRLRVLPDQHSPLFSGNLAEHGRELSHLARVRDLPVLAVLDTAAPQAIAEVNADATVTVALDEDRYAPGLAVTVSERDLGTLSETNLSFEEFHPKTFRAKE
jgi:predicted ATP-dependent serine protease